MNRNLIKFTLKPSGVSFSKYFGDCFFFSLEGLPSFFDDREYFRTPVSGRVNLHVYNPYSSSEH